jgi:hypothetical protein
VKAGVAVCTPEDQMYNRQGERVFDEKLMFGCPIPFKSIKPENVIFVDETGCNTNQKWDGHIGGEFFVLSSGVADSGIKGWCTDIHVSVLCFKNSEGDPILCAIILKSMKEMSALPANLNLGIDRTVKIANGETRFDFIEANLKNVVMIGGPTCFYKNKVIPCYVGCSPNASITSKMLANMLAKLV